jgi:hypothetical protein
MYRGTGYKYHGQVPVQVRRTSNQVLAPNFMVRLVRVLLESRLVKLKATGSAGTIVPGTVAVEGRRLVFRTGTSSFNCTA